MEETNKHDTVPLRELTEGRIRFSITADDIAENQAIHDGFKLYAKKECNNDYTQALKRLLENIEVDFKYEGIVSIMAEMRDRIEKLESEKDTYKKIAEDAVKDDEPEGKSGTF